MKYIATGHGNKDALENKSTKNSESHVREKDVQSIKNLICL